jgi:hypothetical protein
LPGLIAGLRPRVVLVSPKIPHEAAEAELADLEQRGIDVAHIEWVPGVTTDIAFV